MIYFLDGNQEVIKIVRSSAVISAIQTQELPEDNSLLRDYLSVRLKNDERLFNAQYMAIKSYGGNRNAFDLYRIASELVPDNATEFMGIQVAPYELEGVVIEDLRPQDRPLNQTMNQVLEGSDWRIGYVADNLPNVTTNFYYMSVKDTLKKIQELTNVEMLFKVEISGNKITDKWVEVYHQLGNRTMKRFNYGTNALSVVRESSHDELYTALIGRGKGEEVGETESGDATHGRKINFADVEWRKSAGKPVDKPRGQKYIELPGATAEYGIKLIDGRKVPRIGIVDFSEMDDPEKLIQETYQELLVRARPKVLFKAIVINTGDMLIGDTVTIHRHDLGFHYQARVRKVVRDRKNNNKTQVEIGDVVHTPSTKRQGQINSALNNVASGLDSIRGEVTEARQSADGKNTNFYGNVEPDRKKVGDTWFRDHPSLTGESQILVWNGEAWELIMDTSDTTKNAREIEAALEEVEEAKRQAKLDAEQALADAKAHAQSEDARIRGELETDIGGAIEAAEQAKADAVTKANQALTDAKAHADAEDARIKQEIGLEIDGAIEVAEQAKADAVTKANQALADAKAHADAEVQASKEHFDGILAEVGSDVTNAQATADSAVEQIDTAVTNAGFTSLDDTISNVRGIASGVRSELDVAIENAGFTSLDDTIQNMTTITMDAEQSAQEAIDNASNAYGLAQTSISEAQTAQERSLTALGKADNALDGVSNLDIRVDDVEDELELKADNTFMNEDGELTTLSNAITFNAHRFSSDMSRIESRVESLAGATNLVILRGAIKGYSLAGGEVYPNVTVGSPEIDVMRELIDVEPGEQLALTKEQLDHSNNAWRINYYDDDMNYKSRVVGSSNELIITVPSGVTKMWVSYPSGSKPQIMRGTEFLPYRPNMADQMTTNEMVIFRNEYDEFADKTERRLSAIDSTGGSLDILENKIVTTANSVRSDMTALIGNKVDSGDFSQFYQNEYLETVDEVSRKISLSDVKLGTRNLIKSSNDMSKVDFNTYQMTTQIATTQTPDEKQSTVLEFGRESLDGWLRISPFNFELGEEYTFSVWIKRSTGINPLPINIGVGTEGIDNRAHIKRFTVDGEWQKVIITAPITRNTDIFDFVELRPQGQFGWENTARFYIWRPQLEKGNIASDWYPAPEDADAKIDYIETEWIQTFDTFSQTVSGIDGRVTAQKQTLDNISSTVSGHGERLSTVEQTASGLQSQVFDSNGNSRITQLATGIESVVTDLDNLDISGRNLFIESTALEGTVANDGSRLTGTSTARNSQLTYPVLRVQSGETYYFTKISTGDALADIWRIALFSGTGSGLVDRVTYSINSFSLVIPSGVTSMRVSIAKGARPKIEKGDKATHWTPAPEDMATQSQITQLADSISQTVSGIDGRVTTQKQTIDSISSTVSGHGGRLTTVEQTASGLQSAVYNSDGTSKITQLATGVQSLVTNFNEFEVGGRNLIKNSDFKNGLPERVTYNSSVSVLEILDPYGGTSPVMRLFANTDNNYFRFQRVIPRDDTTYTFSAWMRRALGNPYGITVRIGTDSGGETFVVGEDWKKVTVTGKATRRADIFHFVEIATNNEWVNIDIFEPMLEFGTIASPYQVAPEDVQSQITQLSDSINLRVTKDGLLSQINIEAEQTLIQSNKLLLDAKNTIVTGDFAVSGNAIIGGDMQLNKGLRVMNGTNSVLSVVNGNVRMNVGSLFIGSEDVEDKISTAIYQNSKSLGLIYTDEAGQEQSMLSIGADGVYVEGKHIILNGRTVVNDGFMVNGGNVTLNADTTVLGDFTVSGGNVILDADTIVTGDFAVLGTNIILDGNTTITDNFTVTGGNIILDGDTTIHDNFTVTGGNVVLNADTQVQGDFIVSGGNVILDGNTTVRGGFTVLGENVTLDGNTTILGEFSVFGKNITLDADTTILGDFSVFGKNITLDGDTTVTGDFTVGGELVGKGIKADNITTGTLDAGQITVVDLDVSSLSGNKATLIQAGFNGLVNDLMIDSTGMSFISVNGTHGTIGTRQYQMKDVVNNLVGKHSVSMHAEQDAYISLSYQGNASGSNGHTALAIEGDTGLMHIFSPSINVHQSIIDDVKEISFTNNRSSIYTSGLNDHLYIRYEQEQHFFRGQTRIASFVNGLRMDSGINMQQNTIADVKQISFGSTAADMYSDINNNLQIRYPNDMVIGRGSDTHVIEFGANVILRSRLNANSNAVTNVNYLDFQYGASRIYAQSDSHLRILYSNDLFIGRNGDNALQFGSGMTAHTTLNMNGNSVINSPSISDVRLKEVYGLRNENDLEKLMQIEYVNFRWKNREYGGDDLGFVAQQVQSIVPEIMMETADGMLGYNGQSYMNFISHSVQQLALREENTNLVASQALQATESNESKIHKLQQELSKANRRIEELEGAM